MAKPIEQIRRDSRAKLRATAEGCLREIFYGSRNRAKTLGVPFDLKPEDLELVDTCPVLGISLHWGGVGKSDNSPSLDRIRSKLGYVKGNVRIISYRANRIKNDSTPEEIVKVAIYACTNAS